MNTDGTGLRLALWVNDTSVKEASQGADSGQAAPGIGRWNAGINLASNTYLKFLTVRAGIIPSPSGASDVLQASAFKKSGSMDGAQIQRHVSIAGGTAAVQRHTTYVEPSLRQGGVQRARSLDCSRERFTIFQGGKLLQQ